MSDSTHGAATTPAPREIFRPGGPGPSFYGVLTSLVVPRPIAWISTVSEDGVGNLAPHSFFSVASSAPPVVTFTSMGMKDTLRNVLATGEFTISVTPHALMDEVNRTSASFDPDVDEAEAVGLRMEPSEVVRPPRVAASPASLECRLHSTHEIGDGVLVLGEVVCATADPAVLVDGLPATDLLQPVSRLGGSDWGLPPQVVGVDRPA